MPLDAPIKVDDNDNKPVKVKDDPDSLVCRHCHEKLPSRKKLMDHLFSDVCKQPPKPQIDLEVHTELLVKHAALQTSLATLQGHYDTLLAEHETLRHEVAALEDTHTEDLALHETLRRELAGYKDKYNALLQDHDSLHREAVSLRDKVVATTAANAAIYRQPRHLEAQLDIVYGKLEPLTDEQKMDKQFYLLQIQAGIDPWKGAWL